MDIKKVTGVYFSPAGSTKTVVEATVDELARLFKAECRYCDRFDIPVEQNSL